MLLQNACSWIQPYAVLFSAIQVPEQVNLQVADAESVVASFVTRDLSSVPTSGEPFVAYFGDNKDKLTLVKGVTHHYKKLSKDEGISYSLHFIKFSGLKAGKVLL